MRGAEQTAASPLAARGSHIPTVGMSSPVSRDRARECHPRRPLLELEVDERNEIDARERRDACSDGVVRAPPDGTRPTPDVQSMLVPSMYPFDSQQDNGVGKVPGSSRQLER